MLGLIKKDLLMVKSNLKMICIIFAVYLFMTYNDNTSFAFLPSFISIVIMMSTFSYDEFNKTNAYTTTWPNGKSNTVKSKYITTIVIMLVSMIITILCSICISMIKNNLNMEELLSTSIGCIIAVSLIQAILYPFIFKFGVEKSRIALFAFSFLFVGVITLLSKSGIAFDIPESILSLLDNYWMIIFPLSAIILTSISYKISEIVYLKKEF